MITSPFTYHSDPVRIVFGVGAVAALRAEADFHKITRLIVLCSKSRADLARRVTASVADRCAGLCDASAPNMPRAAFDRVVDDLKRLNADGFIVVGGGSPIGLAKAAAVATKLPYIAIVTTYSGSEMAARWNVGVAEDRIGGQSRAALPATAIYDPELTLDLPPRMSAASGMNAMAHAVESLYGADTNPVVQTMAEEAVRRLGASLPRVVDHPRDLAARTDALYGAWLAANFRAEVGLEHAHRPARAAMVQSRPRPHSCRRDALCDRLQQSPPLQTPWRVSNARSAFPMPPAVFSISTSASACRPA